MVKIKVAAGLAAIVALLFFMGGMVIEAQYPQVLIYGNNSGTLRPLKVSSDGTVATSGGSGGGTGTILDGVDPSIIATVFDLTSSNPLAVQLVGTGGAALNVTNAQASATSGQYGMLTQGAVTTAAPSYTNAQTSPLSLTTAGSLRVDIMNGGGGGTSLADNAAFTDNTTNLTPMGGVAESASPTVCTEGRECTAATTLNRALKVTLYDTSGNAITPSTDYTEDAAVSDGNTGPAMLNRRIDTVASSAGSSGDYALFNSGPEGGTYVNPIATAASGAGATPIAFASAASTNSTNVKNAAGNLYGAVLINTTATIYYLRLYNSSSAPTCSSATGYVATIPVPASTSGAGFVVPMPVGAAFTTGISYCFTGGASSTDNTNAATGVYGVLLYK